MRDNLKNTKKLFGLAVILLVLAAIGISSVAAYLLIDKSNTNKHTSNDIGKQQVDEPIAVGSLNVSNVENQISKTISYGTKDTELLKFNLSAGPTEDIELSGVAIEFYSNVYGEQLGRFALRNMRLADERGVIYAQSDGLSSFQETASDKSWAYSTTYTWFNGESTIPKSTTRTFKLTADIPSDSSLSAIHALLPSGTGAPESTFGEGVSAHFKAVGLNSHQKPDITGEARGVVYFRPENDIGSVTVSDDPSFHPTHPRNSKEIILSKINVVAGDEEDVLISKIGMRISNFVPGQFKNIKLVKEGGNQYGTTIKNPPEIESNNPNLVFFGNETVEAGNSMTFNLIADVEIPSAKTSEYGTQLQREVIIYVLTPQNYSSWITARGVESGRDVYVSGAVGTMLQFTE